MTALKASIASPKYPQRAAQRVGFKHRFPGRKIDQRCVGAVSVYQQNLFKAVIGNALGNVEAKGDEDFRFDMDRAGKVDMVEIQSIGDSGQDQYRLRRAAPRLQAHRFAQKDVNVQREVAAVLLCRRDREQYHFLCRDGIVHLRPGQTVVTVFS